MPRRIPLMEQTHRHLQLYDVHRAIHYQKDFLTGKLSWNIPADKKIIVLFDQGNLTTGYPELLVSQGKGSSIKLTYAESLFDQKGLKGNRNEIEGKSILGYSDYFLPDGEPVRLFRPLWFRTWRYLQMEIQTGSEPLLDK